MAAPTCCVVLADALRERAAILTRHEVGMPARMGESRAFPHLIVTLRPEEAGASSAEPTPSIS